MNRLGWGISRETPAKIELRLRRVSDAELVGLAAAFRLSTNDVLPPDSRRKSKELLKD